MSDLTLGPADDGASVELNRGDRLTIDVPENWSTGFKWKLDRFDTTVLEFAEDSLKAEDSFKTDAPSPLVGAGATRHLVFRANGPGTTYLVLRYIREWEGDDSAADTVRATVTVR